MGTWSHEPFGNDEANDWAFDFDGPAKALRRGTQSGSDIATVDAWLKSVSVRPSKDLISIAERASARILGPDSELKALQSALGA